MTAYARTITCGVFTAWPPFQGLDGNEWKITCSRLPGWAEWVPDEATARRAVIDLQRRFRALWTPEEIAAGE